MTRRLLLLNGLAVFCAVLNHALGWGFTSLFWWTDRYASVTVPDFSAMGSPTYYSLRALEQFVTFSVPAFLFVSGFFVAFAADRVTGVLRWSAIRSRLKMLLVPYVLWSIVIFVGRSAEGATDSLAGYADQLLMGRAAEPYYYIPVITQLYLLAPLLVGLFKTYPKSIVLVAAAIQLGFQAARYAPVLEAESQWLVWLGQAPGWFFPHMIFWFVLGGVAGFHQRECNEWLTKWRTVLPWATLALGVTAILEWELLLQWSGREWLTPRPTALDTLYSLSFVLTFLSLTGSRQIATRRLDELGIRSFGIYLIHAPVLELFSRGAYHALPMLLGHQFIFMLSLVAVGIGVPLVLMALVNRTPARPCYNYLFG